MKELKLTKSKIIGIIASILTIITSFIFLGLSELFYLILGLAFFIAGLPFILSLLIESRSSREKDEKFLEFSRDLVAGVKSGTPISQSIMNIRYKDYGDLSHYIQKLANQISLGIPIQIAFETFARDSKSLTISRAVTIISESEKAGGKIEDILESVASSVAQTEKLKKERRASMYNLVIQGYIIFLIFIAIMIVMQFKILPISANLNTGSETLSTEGISSASLGGILSAGPLATPEQLARPFIWLLIVQGFFAGLVIGKLSEGNIKSGFKHSFILVTISMLVNTGAKVLLG